MDLRSQMRAIAFDFQWPCRLFAQLAGLFNGRYYMLERLSTSRQKQEHLAGKPDAPLQLWFILAMPAGVALLIYLVKLLLASFL